MRCCLNQKTSARYEVICVNDGSTDGSADILERLLREYPERLRVITQENQGLSAARNSGIAIAKGEYLAFIDSDDFIDEEYLETLWQRRLATDADMIQIGHLEVDANGKYLSRSTHPDVLIVDNQEEMQRYVTGFVWSGIHRKKVFENLRFSIGSWYEDMITKMVLSRVCHRYAFVEKCLYSKTNHTTNISKFQNGGSTCNPKCIDHLFLVTRYAEYGTKELKLDTAPLGLLILNELRLLWSRTKGMPRRVREAVFVMGGELLRQYGVKPSVADQDPRPCMRRYAHDFLGRNYWKWEVDGWLTTFENHLH